MHSFQVVQYMLTPTPKGPLPVATHVSLDINCGIGKFKERKKETEEKGYCQIDKPFSKAKIFLWIQARAEAFLYYKL